MKILFKILCLISVATIAFSCTKFDPITPSNNKFSESIRDDLSDGKETDVLITDPENEEDIDTSITDPENEEDKESN